ncbi:hypothetical protein JI664_03475 [Rhodobacter sp. NTK016B]|uniref:hypothetical protein n=1 Tax=Rhodobacter sp. NTK016B TaxID=2759676 RepID=UPI001A904088|nr:hypothetical protein [Rhodobacter sp. NTK016B]MBN8291017.1 hypothetical protein [Rhodobacter sp. NTK016B]
MAYGIELTNSAGVPVFDQASRCLRVVASGATIDADAAAEAAFQEYQALPSPKRLHQLSFGQARSFEGPGATAMPHSGFALQLMGTGYPGFPEAKVYAVRPVFDAAGGGFSAFYRWTAQPINRAIETEINVPGVPGGTFCLVNGVRQYRILAPIPTPGGYASDYGMQIRDASGAVIFDSRDTFLAVRFAFIVPKAVADDVLYNGATRDVTLPEPMPNSWVSVPILSCFNVVFLGRRFAGSGTRRIDTWRMDRVELQQIDASTIRVSRNTGAAVEYENPASQNPQPYYSYSHDIIAYLARNVG